MKTKPIKGPKWPADAVERRPVDSLVPYERNARTHSEAQIGQIAKSIQEYGFTVPVLVDPKGNVIAGHGRILAAKLIGLTDVPVMVAKGWSAAKRRAYVILDNKLALNSGWDADILRLELADLTSEGIDPGALGFDAAELASILDTGAAGATDPDNVPDVPIAPVATRGDLWVLGSHRLLCGDATNSEDVQRLMGGEKPHLMVTDPPYGVSLDPSWRDRAGANTMGKSGGGGDAYMNSGKDDVEARWDAVWKLSPCDVFYVWCAGSRLVDVHSALTDAGFDVRQILIWHKMVLTLTRSQYWWCHEHCLYGVRKGATAHWIGKAGQSTVWEIPSPKHIMSGSKEKNEAHPAQKPLDCMKRPIENNSNIGDGVYEPFSGSGTTMMAAETTQRICFGMEIEPTFVDVAIQRWQNFTGLQATLSGKTFEQVKSERQKQAA